MKLVFNNDEIRKKAVNLLNESDLLAKIEQNDNLKNLVEELYIHQIELELQQQELQKANELLEFERQKFADLFQSAPVAFFILNRTGNIYQLNAKAADLLQLPQEIINYTSIFPYLEPASRNKFRILFEKVFNSDNAEETEIEFLSNTNEIIYTKLNAIAYYDANYNLTLCRCIVTDISVQKQYQQKLQDSEQKYRLIAENTSDGILVLNAQHQIIFTSESYNLQLGNSNEVNKITNADDIYNRIHPDDREELFAGIFDAIRRKEKSMQYLYRALHNNGKYIWREDYAKFRYNEEGEHIETYVICRNVTEKIEHSNQIQKLQKAVENVNVGIVITNNQAFIEFANPYFTELTGYEPSEYLGKNMSILKSGIQNEGFYSEMYATLEKGLTWNKQINNRRKDGTLYWENEIISPIYSSKGEITNYVALKTDISEQIKINQELQLSKDKAEANENMLKTLINASPDAIFFKDAEGRMINLNKAALDLFHLHEDEWFGLTDLQLAEKHPEFENELKNSTATDEYVWQSGILQVLEEQIHNKNGDLLVYEVTKIPLFHTDGSRKGIVVLSRNVSEKKKFENELYEAKNRAEQSDKLKSAFLHNMSHEIRTPLNAIVGFSQLMCLPNQPPQKYANFAKVISKNSEKLIGIISDVIDISQIEINQINIGLHNFDLASLTSHIIEQFADNANDKNIELKFSKNASNTNFVVSSDSEKVKRIIIHLIDNAIKFTNEGEIHVKVMCTNEHFQVIVKDTGIGIEPEMQETIFEPFRQVETGLTRNYGGNGLGLSIVKAYSQLLKGEIGLTSEVGKGSIFTLTLPSHLNLNEVGNQSKPDFSVELGKSILIVEDEYSNYLYLNELADEFNLTAIFASNGKQAIDICIADNSIGLVLMDIKMPIMDGYTAAIAIKKIRPNLAIIAQTAYVTQDEKLNYEGIFNDFLVKPFTYIDFKILIERYVLQKQL